MEITNKQQPKKNLADVSGSRIMGIMVGNHRRGNINSNIDWPFY